MPWVKIGSAADLPPEGEAREFSHESHIFCVANIGGEYSALDNVCPHRGGPLGQGVIEGDKLICPWHGWEFNAKTGAVAHAPDQKVKTYPLKVNREDLWIEVW